MAAGLGLPPIKLTVIGVMPKAVAVVWRRALRGLTPPVPSAKLERLPPERPKGLTRCASVP